jgi:hypothetical protein
LGNPSEESKTLPIAAAAQPHKGKAGPIQEISGCPESLPVPEIDSDFPQVGFVPFPVCSGVEQASVRKYPATIKPTTRWPGKIQRLFESDRRRMVATEVAGLNRASVAVFTNMMSDIGQPLTVGEPRQVLECISLASLNNPSRLLPICAHQPNPSAGLPDERDGRPIWGY